MKKSIIWLMLAVVLCSFAYGLNQAHGQTLPSTFSRTEARGVWLTIGQYDITLKNATKTTTCTATECHIYDHTTNISLYNGTFVGNVCAVDVDLTKYSEVTITANNGGGSYTANYRDAGVTSYPYINSQLNWSGGIYMLQDSGHIDCFESVDIINQSSTPPPFTTSLKFPVNGSTTTSWNGLINISLSNVNGSASCNLNNTYWDFLSNDNSSYVFNNSIITAPQNYSFLWNCTDTGGTQSNGSFWINVQNRLTINIFDEQTNLKINESVTFIFRSNTYEYKDTASNGTYILVNESGLPPDTYQITLNGSDYYQRIYYLTVTETQVQEENFYLLKTNQSSLVTFYIKNLADQALEDMSVIFTTWINLTDSNAPVTHRYTDYAGSMLVNLHYLSRYGITITDPTGDYSPKYTEIEPVFASYTIYLDQNSSQNFTTVWDHVSYQMSIVNSTLNPQETNFSFTTASDNANIDYYGFYTTINGTYYLTNISIHPSGGTASLTLPLNASNNQNVEIVYFIATTNPHFVALPLTYSILNMTQWYGNNSLAVIAPEFRTEFSERLRMLIAIFGAIIVMAVFVGFGKRNLAPFAGIPVLIIFAIPPVSWIPVWIVAFVSIINLGFFVAFGDW